jgi:hypothetical protein
MGKLLFFVLVALAVYLIVKKGTRSLPPKEPKREVEDMVRCARCGVHLPRSESVMSGGEFYCGEEHRREGKS